MDDHMEFLNDQRHSLEIVHMDRDGILLRSQHGGLYRVSAVYTPGETMPAPGARLELGPTLHFEYHPEAAVPA